MKVVAVTASPTRLAHMQMAAEALGAAAGRDRDVEARESVRTLHPFPRGKRTISAVDGGRSASFRRGGLVENGRRAVGA